MFIEKEIFDKQYPHSIKSEHIKISDHYDGFYFIELSPLFDRVIKIYKIKKIKEYLINFYDFYLIHGKTTEKVFESILSKELAKEIDKQIIKDVMLLGKK